MAAPEQSRPSRVTNLIRSYPTHFESRKNQFHRFTFTEKEPPSRLANLCKWADDLLKKKGEKQSVRNGPCVQSSSRGHTDRLILVHLLERKRPKAAQSSKGEIPKTAARGPRGCRAELPLIWIFPRRMHRLILKSSLFFIKNKISLIFLKLSHQVPPGGLVALYIIYPRSIVSKNTSWTRRMQSSVYFILKTTIFGSKSYLVWLPEVLESSTARAQTISTKNKNKNKISTTRSKNISDPLVCLN